MSEVKRGRPRVLDDVKKREIAALLSTGYSLHSAARYVGCSPKTIRREMERDEEFNERLRKAKLAARLEPLRALRNKASTHWRAAAWLLERIDPEQFARYDQRLYRPEEVSDLLANIRATLDHHLKDIPSNIIASLLLSRVQQEARLPSGQRHTRADLADIPWCHPTLDPTAEDIIGLGPKSVEELIDPPEEERIPNID